MRLHIIAFIILAGSLQATAQSSANRVYSSADPRYKYNIDTAFILLDNNNYAAAIPFLEAALQITDKSFATQLKLANAFNKTGQTGKCFEILHKICNRHWYSLSSFIDQQENSPSFMFAGLLADKRWAGVTDCVKQKHQAYTTSLETAHILMHQSKYAEAIPYLQSALQVDDKSHSIEIDLAEAYNKAGQTDRCFEILNKIASDWEWMQDFMAANTAGGFAFANLVHDERWIQLKAHIDSLELDQSSGHNRELMHTLRVIERTDQLYRNAVPTAAQPQITQAYHDSIWKIQTTIDSLNLEKIIAIIDKYGYPGQDLVGNKYNAIAWLVIQHASLQYQEKYLPLIKAAAENKQLPMADVALLIDRIEMDNNRPQIYGSQIKCDLSNQCTVYKIIDEPNVNQRRADVGLIPLQDYLSHWGINWPPPK